jgi:3-dehydroquinate synthase
LCGNSGGFREDFSFNMQYLEIRLKREAKRYEITIGRAVRQDLGKLLKRCLHSESRRIGLISNKRVFGLYGKEIVQSLRREDFRVLPWLMPEGERYKSFDVLERAVNFLGENRLERNDVVVALGGGVVGDLAGFAAATYLRGVSLVQVPTTLLAQIDSSVGGKTGINLPFGKNMVGAFHQPAAVLIDTETLESLPRRELVSGFCEMVKQSLVASPKLFATTTMILKEVNAGRDLLLEPKFEELVASHCRFKASIVANDERESAKRSDRLSRRILNFGHTTAHALEAITNYRRFRHGEAVGHGMVVAGEISKGLGLLTSAELESLREAVALCGTLPRADDLDIDNILGALQRDKKSVGGQINWVLLEKIGSPRIVEGKQISAKLLRLSLREGLKKKARQKEIPGNAYTKIK